MVVGHEFVGRIVETGANVKDFRRDSEIVSSEGARRLWPVPELSGRAPSSVQGHAGRRRQSASKSVRRIDISIPMTDTSGSTIPASLQRDVQSIFDPFGNAVHTALSFDLLGEDVLITGAGPIGIMAAAVARHAAARYVVITDVNPYRLELAKKMGATLAVDVRTQSIADAQRQLGMKEGFDVGLEMSGNPAAFRDMVANVCHGGKIAMLGIPEREMAIDWNTVVFNMLTIKGIYGREMYETWYKMTVMLQSGLDIWPVITASLCLR